MDQLAVYQVSVAKRGEGRTTEQTEEWISKRLLPTLAEIEFIDFPIRVVREDRPDLIIEMSPRIAGIEITEVVPPMYAQAVAIRNEHYPEARVDRSIFTWGANFKTREIHNHLKAVGDKLTGPGWTGDAVEREWASAVNESIIKKTERLNNQGFRTYQNNWLAIYTSSPGPQLNMQTACPLLTAPPAEDGKHRFDTIFVLTDSKLMVLAEDGLRIHELIVL
jgi:hypothetical protein